jgi:ABC-type branched-subunit amino acid transport system ATPase component
VYLNVKQPILLVLLGRNGSGKSTLLKSSSELKLPILSSSELMVLKQKIRICFGNLVTSLKENFIPNHFTVAKLFHLDKNKLIRFMKMKQSELYELKKSITYQEITLSGDQVLNNSSHFVLLDEPYNGLSPIMIEK